jgi:hypothetical protein
MKQQDNLSRPEISEENVTVRTVTNLAFILNNLNFKTDAFVRSPKTLFSVIPAEAGIQSLQGLLDSRLRGSDDREDFLRSHQNWRASKTKVFVGTVEETWIR